MSDLETYLEKQMQEPEFKAEHEASMAEFELMCALIAARTEANLSQKELFERSCVR